MGEYKGYRESALIRNLGDLIKKNREDVVALEGEWLEVEKYNNEKRLEVITQKQAHIERVAKMMIAEGVDPYKYTGRIKKVSGYKAWFETNVVKVISEKYPTFIPSKPVAHHINTEVEGVKVVINQSPIRLVELYDITKRQVERGYEEQKKTDKLLIKSIEYAKENNIDIEGLAPKQIIETVQDVAKELYLEKVAPEGTEVYLKNQCYDCSTFIVGNYRCECGNRRISLVVEGDLIEGFYYYAEAN